MFSTSKFLGFMLSAAALVAAVPTPTAAPEFSPALLQKRAGCTFTAASAANTSKKGCAIIVLSNIVVPFGTALDLTGPTSGTLVIFDGETNWAMRSGSNGGKTKPKFFYAHKLTGSSSVKGINILNTPVQAVSINSASGLTSSDMTFDNSAGDANKLGHNTDAFDIGSSTGITITGAKVKNQDDCLAINSGPNIKFTGGTCSGGLSISSVGRRTDNDVSDVIISSSTITKSQNGVRIKTVYGATGSVKGFTYKDIKLSSITSYGIVIDQVYENGSSAGTPSIGVPVTGLTLSGITGTVDSDATNIYILCGAGSCSNWPWIGVLVTGGKKSTKCSNIPSEASC